MSFAIPEESSMLRLVSTFIVPAILIRAKVGSSARTPPDLIAHQIFTPTVTTSLFFTETQVGGTELSSGLILGRGEAQPQLERRVSLGRPGRWEWGSRSSFNSQCLLQQLRLQA